MTNLDACGTLPTLLLSKVYTCMHYICLALNAELASCRVCLCFFRLLLGFLCVRRMLSATKLYHWFGLFPLFFLLLCRRFPSLDFLATTNVWYESYASTFPSSQKTRSLNQVPCMGFWPTPCETKKSSIPAELLLEVSSWILNIFSSKEIFGLVQVSTMCCSGKWDQ